MQTTIADPETAAFLNSMRPNHVREWATSWMPSCSGADWDGQRLYLKYGRDHWHTCSSTMPNSLARWIKRQLQS